MTATTGRRRGASALAGAVEPIAAGVAVTRDKVIAIGVPLATVGRRHRRSIGLPEQAGIGRIGPAAEQQETHDCWGAHCVVQVIVFESRSIAVQEHPCPCRSMGYIAVLSKCNMAGIDFGKFSRVVIIPPLSLIPSN
jgi:hypothetical protein